MPCDIPPSIARGARLPGRAISPETAFFVSGMYRDNEALVAAIIEHRDAMP
ncbi:hypothetical protein [Burkholderia sp. BCC0044]|uniref:hypothetical protein n=1 Tax=Burkholderia sp. BCC0044 TaxID=2676295 RepID=UPI00158CADD2|nr:hypothetical protein [Burkholderia sp. BCC0044]